MARVFVGLGANLGDREATLRSAVGELARAVGIELVAVSTLRETEPWGDADQPPYLNGAVELATEIGPRRLLELLLEVERRLGRVRDGTRWGPRLVDLDLLLYGDEVVDEPGLVVPHPYLDERRFVLEPLVELDPELALPDGRRLAGLLARVE